MSKSRVVVQFPRRASLEARFRSELAAAQREAEITSEVRARLAAERARFLAKAKERRVSRAFWWRQLEEAAISEIDTTVGEGRLRVTFQLGPAIVSAKPTKAMGFIQTDVASGARAQARCNSAKQVESEKVDKIGQIGH